MLKKLNIIALMILLMGQVILGPMGTGIARADTPSTPLVAVATQADVITGETEANPEDEPVVIPDKAETEEPVVDPDEEETGEPAVDPDEEETGEPVVVPDEEETGEPVVDPDDAVIEAPASEDGSTINLKTPGNQWGGTVTVTKVDQKNLPLEGVTFKLEHPGHYSGKDAKIATTDKNGIAKFENLHNGRHILTELSFQGYELCSTSPEPFEIADNKSGKKHHEFTFINAKIGHCEDTGDGEINITKEFEGGETQELSATFGLFDSKGTQIDTKITGKDGLASFTGLDYGTYTVKETDAPKGYSIANKEGQLVTIGAQGKIINLEPIVNLKNQPTVNLVLTKVDYNNPEVTLSNAVFELYKMKGHGKWEKQEEPYTTDANGQIKEKLDEGTYKFKEITAPEGYEIEGKGETAHFTVTKSGTPQQLTVKNKQVKANVVLTKTDKDDSAKTLPNAVFELYKEESYNRWIKQAGTYTTDANGQIRENLGVGKYKFKEISAPEGYEIEGNAETAHFTVTKSGKPQQLTVKNKQVKANVVLTKTDKDDSAKTLPNAVFELYKKEDKGSWIKQAGTYTTDANGQIKEKLREGNYKFKEITAPDGYEIEGDGETRIFKVTKSGKTLHELSVTNKMKMETGEIIIHKSFEGLVEGVLPGAEFQLFNSSNESQGTVTTDPDGKAEFTGLKNGAYTLKEVTAPTGYVVNPTYDGQGKTIIIDLKSKVVIETIKNHKETTGVIQIVKSFEGLSTDLPAAEFELFNSSNVSQGKVTTGPDGKAEFTGLTFGTYTLKETKAPPGYMINSNYSGKGETVKISLDEKIITKEIKNNKKRNKSIIVSKIDEKFNWLFLKGATFTLFDSEGNQVGGSKTTNLLGLVEFGDLPFGTYKLKETIAPTGYVISEEYLVGKEIEIGPEVWGEMVTVKNKKKQSGITLTKYEEGTNQVLSGATFNLYKKELTLKYPFHVYKKVASNMKTGEDGTINIPGQAQGDYYFEETAAPDGYEIIGNNKTYFKIGLDGADVAVAVYNKAILGSVTLLKTDAEGNPLNGAVFDLYKDRDLIEEGIEMNGEAIGKIVRNGLRVGNYSFVETAAPDGYMRDAAPQYVTISNEIREDSVTLVNRVAEGSVTFTKVDENEKLLPGAVFMLDYRAPGASEYKSLGVEYSSATGKYHIENLAFGDYKLNEVKAPQYYVRDNTPRGFSIGQGEGQQTDVELGEPVVNEKGGDIIVEKVDAADNSIKLPGAVFYLYNSEHMKVGEAVSGQDGIATFEGVSYGSYTVKEVTPPSGYVVILSEDNQSVTLEKGTDKAPLVTVKNQKIHESFTVRKVNAANPTGPGLPGAVFKVMVRGTEKEAYVDVEGMGNLVTNVNGVIPETELPPGVYQLIEIGAPTGYKLDSTPTTFTIEKNQTTITALTITNKLTPGGGGSPGPDPGPGPGTNPGTNPDPGPGPLEPQPQTPIIVVPAVPQPEGPNVPAEETPQPEVPSVIVEEIPQPEVPSVIVVKTPRPEVPSVTVKEKPRSEALKATPVIGKTLPKTGEEVPVNLLISGIVLAIIGGWLLFGRRKRRDSQL